MSARRLPLARRCALPALPAGDAPVCPPGPGGFAASGPARPLPRRGAWAGRDGEDSREARPAEAGGGEILPSPPPCCGGLALPGTGGRPAPGPRGSGPDGSMCRVNFGPRTRTAPRTVGAGAQTGGAAGGRPAPAGRAASFHPCVPDLSSPDLRSSVAQLCARVGIWRSPPAIAPKPASTATVPWQPHPPLTGGERQSFCAGILPGPAGPDRCADDTVPGAARPGRGRQLARRLPPPATLAALRATAAGDAGPGRQALPGAPVVVVSRDARFHARLAEILGGLGRTCRAATALPEAPVAATSAAGPVTLLVDLDSLGDVDTVCDGLIALRARTPAVPVVLVSAAFGRDDLSRTRLVAADVSLRDPVRPTALGPALVVAGENNRAWQDRQASLHAAASPAAGGAPLVTAASTPGPVH